MGLRAVRLCLTRRDLLRTQLRALYRASAFGPIAIMVPMIASVWEMKEIRQGSCFRAAVIWRLRELPVIPVFRWAP